MATGVVTWSQTAASNATADGNVNWAEGMAPSQVNDSARAMMASVAKWRDDTNGTNVVFAGPTAFTYTSQQGFASLSAMHLAVFTVYFLTANAANPTLNVDGLGAKSITLTNSADPIPAGFIAAGMTVTLGYDNVTNGGEFTVQNTSVANFMPPGLISPYAVSTAPSGWLLCDGSGKSRTTFANLFSAIGTTFGSSDSSSFKVPNLKGMVLVGMDLAGTGPLGTVSIASTAGASTITLSTSNIPSMTVQGSQTFSNVLTSAGGQNVGSAATPAVNVPGSITVQGSNFTVGGTASGFSVLQPSFGMNYIIKT